MTGQQIANNLRQSKLGWTKKALVRHPFQDSAVGPKEEELFFCVLGLKAYEAGISVRHIQNAGLVPYLYQDVKRVYRLNDKAESKEQLIEWFESRGRRNKNYKIEEFIQRIKDYFKAREALQESR